MNDGTPSQTALTAAAARAAHLIVDDDPPIFSDPLAYPLLGEQAEELVGYHRAHGGHVVLAGARAAVSTRGRHTEDRLAEAVRRGTTQYVILGAGLDTFAYRPDLAGAVGVFEVDHPATQRWKRRLLGDAGVAVPGSVAFVPVDFETDSLVDELVRHGFDPDRPAFVGWLGVTMYLTREAIGRTLAVVGGFAPGTELVVEYLVPESLRDAAGQTYAELVAPVAAERGEPWLTFLDPGEMSALLAKAGFATARHVRQREAIDAALWRRSDSLRPSELSRLAHATVRGPG
ncbi:class I SAM-dependent methyltransferase [Actinomadura scrupuli]|uniref:class I SAM-dependent methyltransferase n=1 Tax=Actinomadura scrupuli TaxID=559629 RepID=UPI003D965270